MVLKKLNRETVNKEVISQPDHLTAYNYRSLDSRSENNWTWLSNLTAYFLLVVEGVFLNENNLIITGHAMVRSFLSIWIYTYTVNITQPWYNLLQTFHHIFIMSVYQIVTTNISQVNFESTPQRYRPTENKENTWSINNVCVWVNMLEIEKLVFLSLS